VDETLTTLAPEGLEAIVVGLPNAGQARSLEYNPYHFAEMPDLMGRGADYMRFLVETIKRLIQISAHCPMQRTRRLRVRRWAASSACMAS